MWEPNLSVYLSSLIQVVVTMVIVPRLIVRNLQLSLPSFTHSYDDNARDVLSKALNHVLKQFKFICNACALLGMLIVLDAWYHGTELLRWDNQSGIVFLSMLAIVGIVQLTMGLKAVRRLSLALYKGIRSASLNAMPWKGYFSKPLVLAVGILQLTLIGSVLYFMANPFPGFAGAANFIGLSVLDGIFIISIYLQVTRSKWPAGISEAQKHTSKERGVTIALFVWSMASLYLCISFWLSAMNLKDIGLISQSIYMMLLLLLGSQFFQLPKTHSE